MSQRFYVYPVLFVALMRLVAMLRQHPRWYSPQIAQLVLIALSSAGAMYFDDDFIWVIIAWSLFVVFLVAPRVFSRLAARTMSTRSLADAATLWSWAGRFAWGQVGRLYRTHAAVLRMWGDGHRQAAETLIGELVAHPIPNQWRGEVRLWHLALLESSCEWPQAVRLYESTDSWSGPAAAIQTRLLAARAYAEVGDFARALDCLERVSLSPRAIGALEQQLLQTRACVAALAGDREELELLLPRLDSFPRRASARFGAYWRGRCAFVRCEREEAERQLSRAKTLTKPKERVWLERIAEQLLRARQGARATVLAMPSGYVEGQEALRAAEQQSAGWRALVHVGAPEGVTLVLLLAFAVVFLVDAVVCEGVFLQPLWLWTGNVPGSLRHREWWRPVTAMFLHGNPLHLLMNSATLWMFGPAVEKAVGRWRLLVIFLLAGTFGNVLSLWHAHYEVSVGASGGIFGVIGAYVVAVHRLKAPMYDTMRRRLLALIALAVACDLTIGWLEPQIDDLAHAGGFIAGLILAIVLVPRHGSELNKVHGFESGSS